MGPLIVAATAIGITGIVTALALIVMRQTGGTPQPLDGTGDDWPYAGVDYLWWDEGIYWAGR